MDKHEIAAATAELRKLLRTTPEAAEIAEKLIRQCREQSSDIAGLKQRIATLEQTVKTQQAARLSAEQKLAAMERQRESKPVEAVDTDALRQARKEAKRAQRQEIDRYRHQINDLLRGYLPSPTAEILCSDDDDNNFAQASKYVLGAVCNPLYAGIGPCTAVVTKQVWIHAALVTMRREGETQFLVNLLHVLDQVFSCGTKNKIYLLQSDEMAQAIKTLVGQLTPEVASTEPDASNAQQDPAQES